MDLVFDIIAAQYVVFFLVGFAMFVGGIIIIIYEVKLKNRSMKIQGYISGVAKSTSKGSKKGQAYYYKLVKFTDPNGEEQEFKGRVGSGAMPDPKHINTPVTVLYVEGETPKIDGKAMYILGGILMVMGVIFAGVYIVNFEFNWMAVLFSIGIVAYGVAKILQKISKIKSIKNADSLSSAISTAIKESKKSIKEKEYEKLGDYEVLDKSKAITEKRKKQTPAWVSVPLFFLSIGLLIGAYYSYQSQSEFFSTAYHAQGTVTGFKESSSTSDGSTTYTYAPIIKFKVDNKTIKFTDNMGSSHPSEKRGDIVDVYYNPNDPNDAQMDKGWLNWILPIILLVLGVLIFYSSTRVYVNRNKYKNG